MKNYLENQIDRLISTINLSGKGYGWKNHPYRSHQGIYISGEPFDYVIITQKKKLCFDAKMTNRSIYAIREKDIRQAVRLKKLSNCGIDCFLLILFKEEHLKKLPIDDFFEILSSRKSINVNDCEEFNYKELFE
jgi:penicillin-binding protein-related factor A (putative recombinase)